MEKLERGTQVIYVPNHLKDLDYTDPKNWHYPHGLQPGFIPSGPNNKGDYFCRYWYFEKGVTALMPDLRTMSNSECTPHQWMVVHNTVPQDWVDANLEVHCNV